MTVTREGPQHAPDRDAKVWSGGEPTGRRRRGGGGRREKSMVPEAHFTSYYGRPILKAPVWKWDIPAYLFTGGLAAGSSLLAAGADLTGNAALRRSTRAGALGGLLASSLFLVHDLGRPTRFHHMLRVAKPTSPMSMGTWILVGYGPAAGLAAVSEGAPWLPDRGLLGLVRRIAPAVGRGAGIAAAGFAPALASYTAVLLADTAVPTWHDGHRHLPSVFVGSAAGAAAGFALVTTPVADAGPARRLAVLGAVLEEAVEAHMERAIGLSAEPLHTGRPGRLMFAARWVTAAGAVGAATLARRSRAGAVAAGAALMVGSVCTRFGVYYAGVESAKDPKYTVVPQRARVADRATVAVTG